MAGVNLSRPHARRLRDMYRSAGWPCLDGIEIDLLAAGLLERVPARTADGALAIGPETLRVTDAGIAALAATLTRNRAAYDPHERLVACVARQMQRAGRVVFTNLSLRARVPADETAVDGADGETGAGSAPAAKPRWVVARPDVFSIRNTSVAGYLAPAVHEVKARRADLLGELRDSPRTRAKRGAYLDMSSECWYVLGLDARGRPIGDPSEVPAVFGVMVANRAAGDAWRLAVARPAPRRPLPHPAGLPFAAWLALSKALPVPVDGHEDQIALKPTPVNKS